MRPVQLKRCFLLREVLINQVNHYSEKETQILVAIYLLNKSLIKCTSISLFKKMAKVHRTCQKKALLITIKKFKHDQMIETIGSKIYLTLKGELHLYELERLLVKVRFA